MRAITLGFIDPSDKVPIEKYMEDSMSITKTKAEVINNIAIIIGEENIDDSYRIQDNLERIEIQYAVEDMFNIIITDETADKWGTLANVISYLEELNLIID